MGWKNFSILYNSLLGLGMTTVMAVLKYNSQNFRLIYVLAIYTFFPR